MDGFLSQVPLEEHSTLSQIDADTISDTIQNIREQLAALHIGATLGQKRLSVIQMQNLLSGLPRLTEQELCDLEQQDSSCPICLASYPAIISEEETALAMDSPAHPIEELGVTRLSQQWQCGHIFCRRDITKWIKEGRDSCPLCRHHLVKPGNPDAPLVGLDDIASLRSRLEEQISLIQRWRDSVTASSSIAQTQNSDDENQVQDHDQSFNMYQHIDTIISLHTSEARD
ncbi:hypothetical protein H0H93_002355 [Arthromyces matolae]|nr:hypothetical protein H0H93_002355 [Arthromyces matolae]